MTAVAKILDKISSVKGRSGKVEFVWKDLGAKKIGKQLDLLNGMALTIGFQGASGLTKYSTGINVATVALYNEFGTPNMPARGFMRRSVRENLGEIKSEFVGQIAKIVTLEQTSLQAMVEMGKFMATLMKVSLGTAAFWAEELAPSTIAGKGHDIPLIETELMVKSISWAVRKGSPMGPILKQGKAS